MNRVSAHLDKEDLKINLTDIKTEFSDTEYRTLFLGDNLSIFMNDKQLETLFDELDKKLHEQTYSDLQDRAISLEIDLDNANDIIEDYREREEERRGA